MSKPQTKLLNRSTRWALTILLAYLTIVFAIGAIGSMMVAQVVPYERVEVVNVDSTLKAPELHARAKRWFVDARVTILIDDPEQHTVVGRGSFRYAPIIVVAGESRRGDMTFRVEVLCDDGRYKVILTDYDHDAKVSLGTIQADSAKCTEQLIGNFKKRVCREEVFPRIRENETALLSSLKAAMMSGEKKGW